MISSEFILQGLWMQHLFGLRPGIAVEIVPNCSELFPFFEANSSLKILKTLDDAVRDFHSAPKAGLDAGACHANPREDNCSERGPWAFPTCEDSWDSWNILPSLRSFLGVAISFTFRSALTLSSLIDTGRSVLRLAADHGRWIPNRQPAMRGLSEVKFSVLP